MDEEEVHRSRINKDVKEIVQAILLLDHNKKPFRHSDIISYLSEKPDRKAWKINFEKAKSCLAKLGLELVEIKQGKAVKYKAYFVINKFHPLPMMYKYASEEELSSRILLTLVLTFIFMKNGTVTSGELLKHLGDLKIYIEGSGSHPYFGDVKTKIFTNFCDQLYLSIKKNPDSHACEISWGQRAEKEITKMSILEFVCKYIYDGKVEPKKLVYYYEKALEQKAQNDEDNKANLEDDNTNTDSETGY